MRLETGAEYTQATQQWKLTSMPERYIAKLTKQYDHGWGQYSVECPDGGFEYTQARSEPEAEGIVARRIYARQRAPKAPDTPEAPQYAWQIKEYEQRNRERANARSKRDLASTSLRSELDNRATMKMIHDNRHRVNRCPNGHPWSFETMRTGANGVEYCNECTKLGLYSFDS